MKTKTQETEKSYNRKNFITKNIFFRYKCNYFVTINVLVVCVNALKYQEINNKLI